MRRAPAVLCTGLALFAGCAGTRLAPLAPTEPEATLPRARVFLIGDGGIASFEQAQVEAQTAGAERKVEKRHRALPPWARPPGGEKKVFKDIVDEVIGLAVKNARQVRLLQTLKGEALNRDRL